RAPGPARRLAGGDGGGGAAFAPPPRSADLVLVTRRISILGATGSIGRNTLDVVRALGGREAIKVGALPGAGSTGRLSAAAREVGAESAVTADDTRRDELRAALEGSGGEAAAGAAALDEAAARPADWVMAALVGAAGLAPTLAAARGGA